MTNRPTGVGPGSGIFSLLFREVGLFSEQAWQWVNERAGETQKYVEERARETGRYIEGRTREGQQFLEDQAKQDHLLNAEDDKRRLVEAEARLLEQIRLAKEAGLDVETILSRIRK